MFKFEVDDKGTFDYIDKVVKEEQRKTLNILAGIAKNEVVKAIQTKGYGSWQPNKMTPDEHPLLILKHFVKGKVFGTNIVAGVLPGGKVNAKFRNRYSDRQFVGYKISMNKKMRRNLAANGYFVRTTTKELTVPARPIVYKDKIIKRMAYEEIFTKRLERRFK